MEGPDRPDPSSAPGGRPAGPRLGLSFDLRNAAQPWSAWPAFYATFLDYVAGAEQLGVDVVKLTEHHGQPDGYIPQPLTMLAAIAARTTKIGLATGVLLAPLHHVVDVAEQSAVIDCISGGRLELGLGAGYVPSDFDLFGARRSTRFDALETMVIELRRLWGDQLVTPVPQHEIDLWAGVRGPRGSELAGRLGMKLLCLEDTHWEDYLRGLERSGRDASSAAFGGLLNVVLADDPPRARAAIDGRIAGARNAYQQMRPSDDESSRSRPFEVRVMTPWEAADELVRLSAGRTVDTVYVPGSLGGAPDEIASRSMELLVTEFRSLATRAQQPAPERT